MRSFVVTGAWISLFGGQVVVAPVSPSSSIPGTRSRESQQRPMDKEGTSQEHCGHIRATALLKAEEGDLSVAGRSSCSLETEGSHCPRGAFKEN